MTVVITRTPKDQFTNVPTLSVLGHAKPSLSFDTTYIGWLTYSTSMMPDDAFTD